MEKKCLRGVTVDEMEQAAVSVLSRVGEGLRGERFLC
jgi:hypothetical protein